MTSTTPLHHIPHLPDVIFVKISSYLSLPSRALLAVALTTDSANYKKINWITQTPLSRWFGISSSSKKKRPSSATKDIIRKSKWNALDFADIDWDLATRLSDNDIGAVLSCINAARYLKKLNLVDLIKITGTGLEPLRGSALKLINFKLLNKTGADLTSRTRINERIVLPILDSILAHGNSLQVICLPMAFYLYGSPGKDYAPEIKLIPEKDKNPYVHAFNKRYFQYLLDKGCHCTHCSRGLIPKPIPTYEFWEIEGHVCSECLNHYCIDESGHCEGRVTYCFDCNKSTCALCIPKTDCLVCGVIYCQKCTLYCDICGESVCSECYEKCKKCNRGGCPECLDWRICDSDYDECGKEHCGECFEEGTNRDVTYCEYGHLNCLDCRFSLCSKNWNEACDKCLREIGFCLRDGVLHTLQEEKESAYISLQQLTLS